MFTLCYSCSPYVHYMWHTSSLYVISGRHMFIICPYVDILPMFSRCNCWFRYVHPMSDMLTMCHLCLTYIISGWDMFTYVTYVYYISYVIQICYPYVTYVNHMLLSLVQKCSSQVTYVDLMLSLIHLFSPNITSLIYVYHVSPKFTICHLWLKYVKHMSPLSTMSSLV